LWFLNISKKSEKSPNLHFGMNKKDPDLVFHFHLLNLFKCWFDQSLTNFKISIKNSKTIKKLKNLRT